MKYVLLNQISTVKTLEATSVFQVGPVLPSPAAGAGTEREDMKPAGPGETPLHLQAQT